MKREIEPVSVLAFRVICKMVTAQLFPIFIFLLMKLAMLLSHLACLPYLATGQASKVVATCWGQIKPVFEGRC